MSAEKSLMEYLLNSQQTESDQHLFLVENNRKTVVIYGRCEQ